MGRADAGFDVRKKGNKGGENMGKGRMALLRVNVPRPIPLLDSQGGSCLELCCVLRACVPCSRVKCIALFLRLLSVCVWLYLGFHCTRTECVPSTLAHIIR